MTEPDLVDALHESLAGKDAIIAELAALRDRFMAERDEARSILNRLMTVAKLQIWEHWPDTQLVTLAFVTQGSNVTLGELRAALKKETQI
jgi:hypothetical protein